MDTIQGAYLDAGPLGGRHSRMGLITKINTSGNPDPLVLDKALSVVLAAHPWGEDHPSGDGSKLVKVAIFPTSYNMCRAQLIYELNQFPVTSSFLIRDSGYLQGWEGNILPGTGEAFQTAWEESEEMYIEDTGGSPPEDWRPAKVPADYIPMRFSLPVRTLSVTAVVFGTPPSGLQEAEGCVNNGTWYGKPKGYWRVDRLESDVAVYSGYYTYTASVCTRNHRDWSEQGVLRSRQTGRYVRVSQDEIDELLGRTYSYGVMQGGTGDRAGKAGILRVCPHPEADLGSLLSI